MLCCKDKVLGAEKIQVLDTDDDNPCLFVTEPYYHQNIPSSNYWDHYLAATNNI